MTASLSGPILDSGAVANVRNFFDGFPLSYDPDYYRVIDDFVGVAVDSTNDWTVVKDSGASVAIQADTRGGRLLMSSAATTDDDGASIQGNEIFALADGKDIWLEGRFLLSDADQMDFFFGMVTNFATNPEACLTAADRVGFQIDDGNASILCKAEKNGTETSSDSEVDAEDATAVTLGIHVVSNTSVEFYVNRILKQTLTTNLPDDENLAIAVMHLSGDATGTKTCIVDYIHAAAKR